MLSLNKKVHIEVNYGFIVKARVGKTFIFLVDLIIPFVLEKLAKVASRGNRTKMFNRYFKLDNSAFAKLLLDACMLL